MRMYLERLLGAMDAAAPQHEFLLLTPFWNKDFDFPPTANLRVVPLPFVPKSRWFRVLYEWTVYPFLIRRARGDVFLGLCNTLPPFLDVPKAVVVQSTQFQFVPESYGFLQRNYLQVGVASAVRRADAVIAVTEHSRQDILRWTKVSPAKVHAVHHGLSLPSVSGTDDPGEVKKRKEEYGSFILCVSAFYAYKNLFRLIEAFQILKSERSIPHRLVIIGADTREVTREALARYARSIGAGDSVKLPGRVPSSILPSLYKGADAFVFPSLYETFGLPVLEAMAMGCPLVVSQRSSLSEVAGDAAETADPLNARSIAAALAKVLTQPGRREELIRRGKERVKDFSWEKTARETLKILEDIAD